MAKTKKKTRSFRERQCAHCQLADERKIRMNRPNFCGYTIDTGKDPDIRNGHCIPKVPTKTKRRSKQV